MIQMLFLALLIVTLMAGFLTYTNPGPKQIAPMGFLMDQSGFTGVENSNKKESKAFNITTAQGISQIRQELDKLAIKQERYRGILTDRQNLLNDMNKDANNIMLATKSTDPGANKDILQLQALTAEMQDEHSLLINGGQDLMALNNQIADERRFISQRIELGDVHTPDYLNAMASRYTSLQSQASQFFDKTNQYNQKIKDQIAKTRGQFQSLAGRIQDVPLRTGPGAREYLEDLLRKESSATNGSLSNPNTPDLSGDTLQKSKDLIDDEHQKQEDKQDEVQQRIEDQQQRIEDEQQRIQDMQAFHNQ